ncbi:MAG: AraC family transcriptional regulator [Planctomycetes bacterium]|nr:AraC family transcriptional regulator [Planctomycetota bacterium]
MTLIIDADCMERFLPLHAAGAKPLRDHGVMLAGLSQLRTAYEVGRQDPGFHLLLFCLGGTGWIQTSDGRRRLDAGDLLAVPARVAARYGLFDRAWDIVWFHLADSGPWRALRGDQPWLRRAGEASGLRLASEALLTEARSDEARSRRMAALHAELIVHHLEREVAGLDDPRTLDMRRQLMELWDLVSREPGTHWSVAALAARMHCSPPTLHRLCARYDGVRPMAMVHRLRMERAAGLLVQTDDPLKRIAEMVGYNGPFAFSAAFKRWCGMSPQEYRSRTR